MKYSSVQKVLAKYIKNRFRIYGTSNGVESSEAEAKIIIDLLEDVGMMPPFTDELCDDIGSKDYFTLHVGNVVYRGLCEWEQE